MKKENNAGDGREKTEGEANPGRSVYVFRMEALTLLSRLLTPHEKSRLRLVFAVAAGAAILEMLAVLSVMPFMVMVSDPVGLLDHPVALWAGETLGLSGARALLLAAGAGMLLLVVVANAVATLSLRQLHLTAWNINHYLAHRLLSAYLLRPYGWFLDRHSSGLNRNLIEEVRLVVQGALVPLLYAGVRGLGALLLVALLLAVDFRMTLVAGGVIGIAYLFIYWGVRVLQDKLGELRAGATRTRFRVASEVLGGIKEVKSLGAEREFLRRFEETGPPFVRATAWNLVISEVPRHLLEVLSVGTVLAILLFLLTSGRSLDEAVPLLTLFAFAGYKLVPAFHQVFTGFSNARFHLPSLREVEADLNSGPTPGHREAPEAAPVPLGDRVELAGVTFRYQGAANPALDGVSLTIRRGERIGVVGPTGAGKTTLVDVFLGLLQPQEGALLVDGNQITGSVLDGWRAAVGYVPQSIFLADDTIAGNIAFGLSPQDVNSARVREAATAAELDSFVLGLPDGYETEVGERGVRLSGGQRQRIGMARALYREPSLLLLDEATSALDSSTEEAVMRTVFGLDRDRTVIIVAHRLATVRRCDRIVLLDAGRISAVGTWEELLETSDLFRVLARGAAGGGVL